MRILAIETSCDETAISIVEAKGGFDLPAFKILANTISSQIAIHKEWGGVVPNIAKREHGKALVPLLETALEKAKLLKPNKQISVDDKLIRKLATILEREPDLSINFLEKLPKISIPKIDAIAVTLGPGLEPALWVGINFARALSLLWQKPLIPVNHMEGHLLSSLASEGSKNKIKFPAVALLASGGHTEIILVKDWLKYKVIGRTRDDAVGEAFDKVARLLGLPYPGGPEIGRLADFKVKIEGYKLPRPMQNSGDFDFSFSGLKTAVLYLTKKIGILSEDDKKAIAFEFQNAALDVLLSKTFHAVEKFQAKTLIVGGGVIANHELKARLSDELKADFPDTAFLIPDRELSTDNATMIALAGYFRSLVKKFQINPVVDSGLGSARPKGKTRIHYRVNPKLKADGNLSL